MMKIVISTATTLMAAAVLVACNGSGTNSNDVTSGGASPVAKAVCTSSNNWQSVGLGMSSAQVEARLGKPVKLVSTSTSTEYHYERCRGFLKMTAEGTPATDTTPAKAPTYVITDVGGVVVISAARGVTAVTSPVRIDELTVCELDYFNYPYDSIYSYNSETGYATRTNCRAANNQF